MLLVFRLKPNLQLISEMDIVTMGTVCDMISEGNRNSMEWMEQTMQADADRI